MALTGTYVPSAIRWVRDNVELYESTGGQQGNAHPESGAPILIVTMRGATSGDVRKIALMKVEHDGVYALVASMGGAPKNPVWYHNLITNPDEVTIQDGPSPFDVHVHLATGDERAMWWERAVAAFPPYGEYQAKTDRIIPVLIATPVR
jgi:F420H(2)-dependent quinone reductase